jgi:putative transposase
MISFKGHRFEKTIILTCVRWYLAYPLSYRHLVEMMEERNLTVAPSTIYRWLQKFTPKLESAFRKKYKKPVVDRWKMDETYIQIKGEWRYLYRVVDMEGKTVDFLLTANRDKKAALRFFKKAISLHGRPDTVTIDKSGANIAALSDLNEGTTDKITIRQSKYLNNLVEQDHRAIKRIVRPALGFKSFRSARTTL